MVDAYLPYMIMEGFCFLYVLSILLRINSNVGSKHALFQLKAMIFAYFTYLVFDIFCLLIETGVWNVPSWVNALFCGISVLAIPVGAYFWFRFVEARLMPPLRRQNLFDWLFAIPLGFILVSDIVSMFTGWLFFIDPTKGYSVTDLFVPVQGTINYFYLVIPTIYSIYCAIKARSRQAREECIVYAVYMIAPLVGGLLEDTLPQVPILALTMFLLIQIIFLTIQNMQIYNDALTNLNNRRHLDLFLDESLPSASSTNPVTVFMMDINGFKTINDRYGHVEGDNALKLVASVLKEVASRHNAFTARYGGDEFAYVSVNSSEDPVNIVKEIKDGLVKFQTETIPAKPYEVSLSIGYTRCLTPTKTPDPILEEADRLLYQDKEIWHQSQKH